MPDLLTSLRPPRLDAAPSDPRPGELYYDITERTLYWWGEVAWVPICLTRGVAVFSGSTQPEEAMAGDLWFSKDAVMIFDNGEWRAIAPLSTYLTWSVLRDHLSWTEVNDTYADWNALRLDQVTVS